MKKHITAVLLCLSTLLCGGALASGQIDDARQELEHNRCFLSGRVLALSHFQDALIIALVESESRVEFQQEMEFHAADISLFQEESNELYHLRFPGVEPQTVELPPGSTKEIYLNTFKKGCGLSSEERHAYFAMEMEVYERDKKQEPFELTKAAFAALELETIYNFALLPSGKIIAGLEKPGGKKYHVRGSDPSSGNFTHPNHTVLAGHPDQGVLTAGAMMVYNHNGKRMVFLSNKTGHFQTPPHSLEWMIEELEQFSQPRETIIPLMDVDFGKMAYGYSRTKLLVALTQEEARSLFSFSAEEFFLLHEQDRLSYMMDQILEGNFSNVDIAWLTEFRVSAQQLVAAFNLFDEKHEAPKAIHTLSKRLGRLLDAARVGVPEEMQRHAGKLKVLLSEENPVDSLIEFHAATKESFAVYIRGLTDSLQKKIEWRTKFTVHEYHTLKKEVRELGILFHSFTLNLRDYQLSRTACRRLTNINDRMKVVHDAHIERKLLGLADENERMVLTSGIVNDIQKAIDKITY